MKAFGAFALCVMVLTLVVTGCLGQSDGSRIRMSLSQNGINSMENITFPLVRNLISTIEPVHVPDVTQDIVVLGVTLGWFRVQNISIGGISFDDVPLTITENQGLQMNLVGLRLNINYTLVFHLALTESYPGQGTVNETDISILFTLRAGRHGQPLVNATNISVQLGSFNPGIEGFIPTVVNDLFHPLIVSTIESVLPAQLSSTFDTAAAAAIDATNFIVLLDPFNATSLNVSFTQSPVFSADRIAFYLSGDVMATNLMQPCTLPAGPDMPEFDTRDIEMYFSQTVLGCALAAFRASEMLPAVAAPFIASLNLDGRFSIIADFDSARMPVAQFGNGSANMLLPLNVTIDRTALPWQGPAETFIVMPADIDLAFSFSVTPFWQLMLSISEVAFQFYQPQVADDWPPELKQDVINTNYTAVSINVGNFLNTLLLPYIVNYTAKPITVLPTNVTFVLLAIVREQEVVLEPDFLFLGADIVQPAAGSPLLAGSELRVRHGPGYRRPSPSSAPHFADDTFTPFSARPLKEET